MIGPIAKKIGQEVAEEIAKKAAPVSKKIVKAVEDKADDWGWKGGKPGEITGTKYLDNKGNKTLQNAASRKFERDAWDSKPVGKLWWKQAQAADPYNPNSSRAHKIATSRVMRGFAKLEKAGIPREYTGKLLPRLDLDKLLYNPTMARDLSKNIKSLTTSQRDTFLSLLPEWEGSLDDLIRAARTL